MTPIYLQKHKINTAYIVPPLMVYLSKNALVDKYNLTSLQVIWCGAAPLSKEVEDAVRARIGIPVIRQGYGMTEGTLAFTGQTDDFHKSGSVGVIRKGTWGKIVDTETGAVLGPHGQGELCFKATTIMKGYVGDQLATSATIDKDGWLHTGDIGYYDENREFFIVDRIKELIKYKAFQVPPAEIEAVLLTHSGVKDVGVIGVPDEDAGELAFAFVVSQPNTNLNREEIIKYVAGEQSIISIVQCERFLNIIYFIRFQIGYRPQSNYMAGLFSLMKFQKMQVAKFCDVFYAKWSRHKKANYKYCIIFNIILILILYSSQNI